MAEHCILYALRPELPPEEALVTLSPGADVLVRGRDASGSWNHLDVRWPQASLTLTRMGLGEKTFDAHLTGLVTSLTQRFRGNLDLRASALLERLTRSKWILGTTALPDFETEPLLSAWLRTLAEKTHGVLALGHVLLDASGRALLKDDLGNDPDAVLWVSEEALARKQRSEQRLANMGVPIQRSEPPLDGVEESWPRSAPELALRAQVLWVCALRGEGLPSETSVEMLTRVGLWEAATPREQAFLKEPRPSSEACSQYTWGHEAVWVLLWALGHVPTLYSPTSVCDVAFASGLLSELPVQAFVEGAQLRPVNDLLEEADFHGRLFASVKAQERQNLPVPGGLHPDVVYERQRVFRWLFRHWKGAWHQLMAT